MPRKKKNDGAVDATLPEIPSELLDQFVTGPMTAESVEAVMRKFKKAIIERVLGAEMTHHLGYAPGGLRSRPAPATIATAAAARRSSPMTVLSASKCPATATALLSLR